ncbi:hypothetical protein [Roseobacter cerasinus]|nr:hypothetical protein [Roseobacter cerasinus]
MIAKPSMEDIKYKERFEAGQVGPSEFRHRDHLRLVYVYLCENSVETANDQMRRSITKFLKNNDVPASKYHETLTLSWTQAVKHFMVQAGAPASFDEFIAFDARLLDTNIMLTHYDPDTLFSDRARSEFIPPDVEPVPQYT